MPPKTFVAGEVLTAGDTNTYLVNRYDWDSVNNEVEFDSVIKLVFGGDANLYRSAANTLKTDDTLSVNGAELAGDGSGALYLNSGPVLFDNGQLAGDGSGALYTGGSLLIVDNAFMLNATERCIQMQEVAGDPPAPAANKAKIFVRDNGSGKTQLAVRFPSGAVQTISTEP